MSDPQETIALLRHQLAGLLSLLDTPSKPHPDAVNGADHNVPGPEWRPAKGYTIRVSDPDAGPPVTVHVIWPDAQWSGDMDSIGSQEARRLAMALLAAADWADSLAAGVSHLDRVRSP